jgi:hypothetical protein
LYLGGKEKLYIYIYIYIYKWMNNFLLVDLTMYVMTGPELVELGAPKMKGQCHISLKKPS